MRQVKQKQPPFKSQRYLRWVRTLPCSICGTDQNIEAHHIIGHNLSGMGMKPHDTLTMPLCQKHHKELHDNGAETFDRKYRQMRDPAQVYHVNLTLGRARVQNQMSEAKINEAKELLP